MACGLSAWRGSRQEGRSAPRRVEELTQSTNRQSTEICPEHDRAVMFRVNAAAGVARPLQPFCGTSGLARYDICRARVSRALLLFLPEQERGRDDSGQASRLGFRAGAFSLAHRVGRAIKSPTAFRPWGEVSHAASRSSSVSTLAVPASSLSSSSWLSNWRCRVSRSSSRPSCSNGRCSSCRMLFSRRHRTSCWASPAACCVGIDRKSRQALPRERARSGVAWPGTWTRPTDTDWALPRHGWPRRPVRNRQPTDDVLYLTVTRQLFIPWPP